MAHYLALKKKKKATKFAGKWVGLGRIQGHSIKEKTNNKTLKFAIICGSLAYNV